MFSLRLRLTAGFMLVAAIPLMLVWVWPRSGALDRELENVRSKHLLIAQNLGSALERYHDDIVSTFEFFARAIGNGNKIVDGDQLLSDLRFRHVCIVDFASGRVVDGILTERVKCPKVVPAKRYAVFKKLAVPGQTVMTGVVPGPKRIPTLYIVRKEKDLMIVGAIETSYFTELGKQISFGVRGHAAIVDQFGKVLSHPLPDWIAAMKDISKVSTVKRMLNGESGVQAFFSPALKDDMISGFTSVKGAGWGVMIPQPMSELKAKAAAVEKTNSVAFAFGMIAALLASILIAHTVAGPCNALVVFARKRLDRKAMAKPKFETALVSCEFKALADAIEGFGERTEILEAEKLEAENREMTAIREREESIKNTASEFSSYLDRINGLSSFLANEVHGELGSSTYKEYASEINQHGKSLNDLIVSMSRREVENGDRAAQPEEENRPTGDVARSA